MALSLLAIDTSTEVGSIALWHQGQLSCRSLLGVRQHGTWLLPGIHELMAQASVSLSQLDALVLGAGPGGFTGIRIATGVVQGLAFALDKPVLLGSGLQALAQGAWRCHQVGQVFAAIDARMGELYCGLYQEHQGVMSPVCADFLANPNELPPITQKAYGAGSGWAVYPDALQRTVTGTLTVETSVSYPLAEDLIAQALVDWHNGLAVSAEQAQPRYLRDKVAWNKLPGRE